MTPKRNLELNETPKAVYILIDNSPSYVETSVTGEIQLRETATKTLQTALPQSLFPGDAVTISLINVGTSFTILPRTEILEYQSLLPRPVEETPIPTPTEIAGEGLQTDFRNNLSTRTAVSTLNASKPRKHACAVRDWVAQANGVIDEFDSQFEEMFRFSELPPIQDESDIYSALFTAHTFFSKFPETTPKYLIIFSDMHQYADSEPSQELIFSNTKVLISHVPIQNIDPKVYDTVEKNWRTWFESEFGIDLTYYSTQDSNVSTIVEFLTQDR